MLVYLFGAPPSRRAGFISGITFIAHIDPHMPDLPDVVFWRVLTFMFGTAYDYPLGSAAAPRQRGRRGRGCRGRRLKLICCCDLSDPWPSSGCGVASN